MKLRKIKNQNAITLIALVITIIVLLILAGVSLSLVVGEDGIVKKAVDASKATDDSQVKEIIGMAYQQAIIGQYLSETDLATSMEKDLESTYGTGNVTVTKNEDGTYTVEIQGKGTYDVDAAGTIGKQGAQPQISNLTITLENGDPIPDDGAPTGTILKIAYNVSIDGGTIENVTPGTYENGQVTYVITDAEATAKKVTFSISYKVDGESATPKTYEVDLKDKYESSEFSAAEIQNDATTYFGTKVTGYTCAGTGVDVWRIFYADEDNIYLIADDYISFIDAPNGRDGSALGKVSSYKLDFGDVYRDYSGSEWILGTTTVDGVSRENSLAKKWLNKYFNYTSDDEETYPNKTSTNPNIRMVAYILDTHIWSIYANSDLAAYAIGGPTMEMFCTSYVESHPGSLVSTQVRNTNGYDYPSSGRLLSRAADHGIYVKSSRDKADGMWLASPSYTSSNYVCCSLYSGVLSSANMGGNCHLVRDYTKPGLRPLVCLNSEVKLTKVEDDEEGFIFEISTEND